MNQLKIFIIVLLCLNQISMNAQHSSRKYRDINGLKMYYEVHGKGDPLVLLHGGGSTIESTFGKILPLFARTRQVIAIELQAHGRTQDIDRPLSFEQDADDVIALLKALGIPKADFLGFSNGGTTCIQIAIRDPQRVNKLVLASAISKRSGMQSGFFEGMKNASLANMPPPLVDAFLKVNPDRKNLEKMFYRDVTRMLNFKDIDDALIGSIQAPALVINADEEVVRTEHALELSNLLPGGRLVIIPGNHGEYIGEICAENKSPKIYEAVAVLIEEFLGND
jgi:pimeloyl-ACP methyl ester carboxylesterase